MDTNPANCDINTSADAKVLVVDDDPMNLKITDRLLKLSGITAVCVLSGSQAVDAMSRMKFAIVFLDHLMPEMDGIDTLNELKKRDLIGGAKMIMLTANVDAGAAESYLAAGFDAYLAKPIRPDKLKELLAKYLPKDETPGMTTRTTSDGSLIMDFTPKKPAASPDEALEKVLSEKAGISMKTGLGSCNGDTALYRNKLSAFASGYGSKTEELEEYLADKEWLQYCVLAHLIRSSAAALGAEELTEMAKGLEDASKHSDAGYVGEHHAAFIEKYRNTAETINGILKEINS